MDINALYEQITVYATLLDIFISRVASQFVEVFQFKDTHSLAFVYWEDETKQTLYEIVIRA